MFTQRRNKIAIINGPNLNILGLREPEQYGNETWEMIENMLREKAKLLDVELLFYQSNHEGCLVNFIQEHLQELDGVVINPAAFTKHGYSILDALTAIPSPFVEVHLSNINARGGWHAETIFASKAIGHINGFQGYTYILALEGLCNYLNKRVR